MPAERIYEQQTSPRPAAAMPLASPDQYGAQIGEALGQAGQQLHQSEVRAFQVEKRLEFDAQAATWNENFVRYRTNHDDIERERRNGPSEGYTLDVEKALGAGKEALFGQISNPDVRRQAEAQWTQWAGGVHGRAADWEDGQRIANGVKLEASTQELQGSRVYRQPEALKDELTLLYARVDAASWPDDVKTKIRDAGERGLFDAQLRNRLEVDPAAAKLEMALGVYDGLGPERLDEANRRADVEIHSRELAARSAAAAGLKDLRGQVSNAKQLATAGHPQDMGGLAALEASAKASGDQGMLLDAKEARATNEVVVAYANATPAVLAGEIAQLDAAIAAQGTNADPLLTFRRNALAGVQSRRREEVSSNPGAIAARLGMPLAPIDWDNPPPAEVARRASAIEAVSEGSEFPPAYFQPDEVAQLRSDNSVKGKLAALRAARAFGDRKDFLAAQQLFPNDRMAAYVVALDNEDARRMALNGREALKVPGGRPKGDATAEENRDAQDARFRAATRGLGEEQRRAMYETADAIEAWLMADGREPGGPTRALAIQRAVGGDARGGVWYGGLGNWNGAFLLSDGVSQAQFNQAAVRAAAAQKPVNPDGSPFLIKNGHMVPLGPGLYGMTGADGGEVRQRGVRGQPGRRFTFRVRP